LNRPYFTYDPDTSTISIMATLGRMSLSTHTGKLRFKDGRLRCTSDDGRTRTVPVRRVLSNPEHWQRRDLSGRGGRSGHGVSLTAVSLLCHCQGICGDR
jgi:hypothetical protein